MNDCVVCGWRRAIRQHRCSGCYQFLRRKGRDRTVAEVTRQYERMLERVEEIMARPDVAS